MQKKLNFSDPHHYWITTDFLLFPNGFFLLYNSTQSPFVRSFFNGFGSGRIFFLKSCSMNKYLNICAMNSFFFSSSSWFYCISEESLRRIFVVTGDPSWWVAPRGFLLANETGPFGLLSIHPKLFWGTLIPYGGVGSEGGRIFFMLLDQIVWIGVGVRVQTTWPWTEFWKIFEVFLLFHKEYATKLRHTNKNSHCWFVWIRLSLS